MIKGAVRQHDSPQQPLLRAVGFGMGYRNGPKPLARAVYFFLWNERLSTIRVANEIISAKASLALSGITSLPGD